MHRPLLPVREGAFPAAAHSSGTADSMPLMLDKRTFRI